MSHDDFASEPDPALPGHLPEGERILWQGAPDWRSLVWRVYHLREVVIYFGILLLWRGFSAWWETGLISKAMASASPLLIPMVVCAAILVFIAVLSARSTVYTITSGRLVFKIGIAVPTTFNLPFSSIGDANVRALGLGCGDIGVTLRSDDKLAYLVLWPHARPWHLKKPQPMMRSVPDGLKVAGILSNALQAEAGQPRTGQPIVNQGDVTGANSAPHGGLTTANR
jgi:Bacterial PH domain